jgi:hypothetical protein
MQTGTAFSHQATHDAITGRSHDSIGRHIATKEICLMKVETSGTVPKGDSRTLTFASDVPLRCLHHPWVIHSA